MKKYFANMSVNNGTHYRPDWEGTNYKKLAAAISASARANCFIGNDFQWEVWDEDEIIVAAGAGRKTNNGFCYMNCSELVGQHI